MRLIYMGTPEYAATILRKLDEQHEVVAVYTRPDAVRGRGKKLVPSPVKEVALERDLAVFEPRTLRDSEVRDQIAQFNSDAICVAAYGAILPEDILNIPVHGCFNVHASLLPRWRGAAPIERAILTGDDDAGVCVMRMEKGLDTGDYCKSASVPVGARGTLELTSLLAEAGADCLLEALNEAEAGSLVWTKQDESLVTYAEKVGKHELDINPEDSVLQAARKVQASTDAHPSRCEIAGKRLTVIEAALPADETAAEVAPGLVRFAAKRLFLGFSDGALELVRVKPDGKKEMEARAFAAGVQNIKSGSVTWEGSDAAAAAQK